MSKLFDKKYGKPQSKLRQQFEHEAKAFCVGELIKEARRKANLTQQQVAEKVGCDKPYISKVENNVFDIQMGTFLKIIEEGIGARVRIDIY